MMDSFTGDDFADLSEDEIRAAFDDAGQGAKGGFVLPFICAADVEPCLDSLWLIDDWLPQTGVACLYGHPGCGKSFLALDMGAAVADGREWAGRYVDGGLVVYLVAEGQSGFKNRLYALRRAGGLARPERFHLIPTPIDLQKPNGEVETLRRDIETLVAKTGERLAMLVIDTLSKTYGGGDENGDDMVSYVANCQRLASQFDCLALIVHHRPKDSNSREMRGHSSLKGGIDTTILVESGNIKSAETLKQKDGPDHEKVQFKLKVETIGSDSRGKEVTTCLVELTERTPDSANVITGPEKAKRGLKGKRKIVYETLLREIHTKGQPLPDEIPKGEYNPFFSKKCVTRDAVRDILINELLSLANGDEDKRRDTAKREFNRYLVDLKTAGLVGAYGEFYWIKH